MKKLLLTLIILCAYVCARGQVGDYRNRLSVGASGGYVLASTGFVTTVPQNMLGGITAGVAARYTTEKYFSTLCAVQMEVNITQQGWKEKIETYDGLPVINPLTGMAEKYERKQMYVEIPILAHLSWGKEKKGCSFFFNLGPQIGFNIGESTTKNYEYPYTKANVEAHRFPGIDQFSNRYGRISIVEAQETMPIENKFDYGIAAGLGIEFDLSKVGRFSLEGRYYYGLGNIYGDSKRDYFAASNHNTIYIKLGFLHDLGK